MLAALTLAVVAAAAHPAAGHPLRHAQVVQLGSDRGYWSGDVGFASAIDVFAAPTDFAAESRRLMREVRREGRPFSAGPRYGRPALSPVVDLLPLLRWAAAGLAER